MILNQYTPNPKFKKDGTLKKKQTEFCFVRCDNVSCRHEYEERRAIVHLRRQNLFSNGKDICPECTRILLHNSIANIGTTVLKSRTIDQKRYHASIGGKAQKNSPNTGRFSTEKWNQKTKEEQRIIVKRANDALHEKLKDPILAAEHFAKVMKDRIGFISIGQTQLFDAIKHLGFELEVQIERIKVDMCHSDLKLVVEFNGDAYHCNPKKYKPDFYSTLIRMTAKEKWEKDRARTYFLTRRGYTVLYVWESDWIENQTKCTSIIKNTYDTIIKNRTST